MFGRTGGYLGKQVGHEKLEILDVEVEVPLMADYEQFHLGAGKPGKNFLYADGSVDFNLR
ncbi:MAG: hypothetical protein QF886_11525 [Planctomycetota bacterium]|nr:hypothetical protein [Planctomycetota bacterium]